MNVSEQSLRRVEAHPLVLQWMNDMEDDGKYDEFEMWSQLDDDSGIAEPMDTD